MIHMNSGEEEVSEDLQLSNLRLNFVIPDLSVRSVLHQFAELFKVSSKQTLPFQSSKYVLVCSDLLLFIALHKP